MQKVIMIVCECIVVVTKLLFCITTKTFYQGGLKITTMMTPTSSFHDDEEYETVVYEQGFEVSRFATPQRGRSMQSSSPMTRKNNTFSQSPARRFITASLTPQRNKLGTPMRAFSFRRRRKQNVPPGSDSEAALFVRVSCK